MSDGALLTVIGRFLKAGVLEDGIWEQSEEGAPPFGRLMVVDRGGVISPLLPNIFLDGLDHMMEARGHAMTRYAEDMVILCQSAGEGEAALGAVRNWMEEAGLRLHPEKTRVVDMTGPGARFDFLGYRFRRTRQGRIIRLARPKSLQKLRETIRPKIRRSNARSMRAIRTSGSEGGVRFDPSFLPLSFPARLRPKRQLRKLG